MMIFCVEAFIREYEAIYLQSLILGLSVLVIKLEASSKVMFVTRRPKGVVSIVSLGTWALLLCQVEPRPSESPSCEGRLRHEPRTEFEALPRPRVSVAEN